MNKTLYEDFPWVHQHYGSYSHDSAAFLPWHRYFIQVYEDTLREECGYTGTLPYWNWVLDWEDIAQSPVWDPESGFGGDGNITGSVTVNYGRCVIDGPFAGLQASFFGNEFRPHCLSRGFLKGDQLQGFCGSRIRPEVIEETLRKPDYESFISSLEDRAHNAIPTGIKGDFGTFTAPYDPVFFLHHTQIDRLWWLWQQEHPERLTEYSGFGSNNSSNLASLSDMVDLNVFARSVPVSAVMNTAGVLLCYQY